MNRLHFLRQMVAGIASVAMSLPLGAQLDRLTYPDLGLHGHFGREIALAEDHIILAEPNYTSLEYNHSGRIHIFRRNGNQWVHEGLLDNAPTQPYNHFGHDVVIYGSDMAVSAPDQDHGIVYLYSLESGTWNPVQEIEMPQSVYKEGLHVRFGEQVGLFEDWLAISAPGYLGTADSILRTGAVFIFKKETGAWAFHQLLLPPDLTRATQFGNDIEISSIGLVITAAKGDGGAEASGVVYLYQLNNATWQPSYTFIDPASRSHELFGADVDLDGNALVIGVPMYTLDESTGPQGAVHVFQRFDDTWVRTALITASDARRNDLFGSAVTMDQGHIIIGAPRHDQPNMRDVGKVYHFTLDNGFYTEKASFLPLEGDAQAHMQFGGSLGLRNPQLIIGSHLMNNALEDSGIAYTLDIDQTTSADDPALNANHLAILPNPVGESMQLNLDDSWKQGLGITLYNIEGRIVKTYFFRAQDNQLHLDVSTLAPGTYFLHATDGHMTAIHKWIKI